ncbi:hypothetical protein BDA99DRAFT_502251 [Phascolomyces articulosus]|uniref:PX domain-containing protein n=1 Tax=Phascolomyces articulosus TaxID=60185 RepID=A0AAD5K5P7_9FUNG|nr:hypothetical protein BDA99DRAFT_502251 [Phascolomyces articulosus]
MNSHFIKSAAVRSYECRGKETWYQLQVNPNNEPGYRIYRRYEDFLRLDANLDSAYYTATKATIARSQTAPNNNNISFYHHDSCNKNSSSNSSRRRAPSYTDRLCKKNCLSSSTSSLTATTVSSFLSVAPPNIIACPTTSFIPEEKTALPSLRNQHPTQEIYWLANKRAKRKWQYQHIDRYLSQLFMMPLEVSQSPIVLRFFNYQPYRYYHFTKSLPPTPPTLRQTRRQIMQRNKDDDNNNKNSSLRSENTTTTTTTTAIAAPITRRKLLIRCKDKNDINILNKKNINKVDVEGNDNEIEDNKTMVMSSSSIDVKSQSATLIAAPHSTIHSWNDETIQIFLFLSPRVFITVQINRRSTLEELRDALDRELGQRHLDPLPTPSVLAYHHVSRSDRQGALYTLTLNCSEPWLDQDTLMTLASARYLTFFSKASNFLPPPPSPPLPSSSPASKEKDTDKTSSTNHQQPQQPHPIQQGIVLLIASDSDLDAAMNGKWRRLDHVTLTCLAW